MDTIMTINCMVQIIITEGIWVFSFTLLVHIHSSKQSSAYLLLVHFWTGHIQFQCLKALPVIYLGKQNLSYDVPVCPRPPSSILGLFCGIPYFSHLIVAPQELGCGFSSFHTPSGPSSVFCIPPCSTQPTCHSARHNNSDTLPANTAGK